MVKRKGTSDVAAAATLSPSYSVSEMIHNAEAVAGVKPEVMAGAFHNIDKDELTVKEAQSLVQQFMKKRVK